MTNEFWIITSVHVVVFFVSRHFLSKKSKRLQNEKAMLSTENKKQAGEIAYFKELMKDK